MKEAELADGTVLEFPDETPDSVIDSTVKKHVGTNKRRDIGAGVPDTGFDTLSTPDLRAYTPTEPVKQTPIRESLPELQNSGLLAGENTAKTAVLAPALLTATDPNEIAKIITGNFPNVGAAYDKDSEGNITPVLVNNKTGAATIINKPGLSTLDAMQALGIAAAYAPATSGPAAPLLRGAQMAATEAGIQSVQAASGGDFNKGDVALSAGLGTVGQFGVDKIGASLAKRAVTARRVMRGSSDKSLAKFTVDELGKLQSDPAAKAAISQGFDEGFIQQVKTSAPEDKRSILRMVRIARRALRDNRFASRNRINQVVGDALEQRVNNLNQTMNQAASKLDGVAASLKGKPVNYSKATTNFVDKLDDLGIKLSQNESGEFVVSLKGSDIEGATQAKGFLERILNRTQNVDDAFSVHKLKRFIDRQVTYGAGQDKGLKGEALRAVKSLRHDLDSALDSAFPQYNKINTQYADTRNALDLLQEAWGGKVNMFSESAPKQLGIQSRKLLSNYSSGTNQLDAIDNAEKILRKYGVKVDNNIMDLVSAESALRSFLPQKLFNTFQGDIEKAGGNIARSALQGNKLDVALKIGQTAIDKVSGKSPESALKALESVLKQ